MTQGVLFQFTQIQQVAALPITLQFGGGQPEPTIRIQFERLNQKQLWPLHVKFGDGKPAPVVPIKRPNIGIEWQLSTGGPVLCSQHIEVSSLIETIRTEIRLNQHRLALQRQAVRASMKRYPMQRQTHVISTKRLGKQSQRYAIGWQNAPLQSASINVNWQAGDVQQSDWCVRYIKGQFQAADIHLAWRGAIHLSESIKLSYALDEAIQAENHWRYGPKVAAVICTSDYKPQKGKVTLRFSGVRQPQANPLVMRFIAEPEYCYWDEGGGLIDAHPTLPDIDFNLPIGPQIRRSYIMKPTVSCQRLSDGQAIALKSASYQHGREQFAGTWSVAFGSRIDMQRAMNQLLELNVNGYLFLILIEQSSTSHAFGSQSWLGTGRSRLAELSAPYLEKSSMSNQTQRSLLGIMSDILVNTGWTVTADIVDHIIPAHCFSYRDKTPAEAIAAMAKSCGAMLLVDDAARSIHLVPKWPVTPWNTQVAVADVVLIPNVITAFSERKEIRPVANKVLVRGEQQGVACGVRRQGTPGDKFADDVVDNLITDVQAARQRGTAVLADAGDKIINTIKTKLMPDLLPITPGMLVGVSYDAEVFKATCDSLAIDISIDNEGKLSVNQTITLMRNAA
ncbi:hypothetical protein K6Y31_06195 [Motilimonas cestriensis]|uniref:Phage protein n=1 Tax=Motilimonas cestriensis TaxID=2742685 RepID=A0ABS8W7D7_9GAMM|nr:hypothetical protein [Motilimonas cestriensis]MCE2594400.1 hypothetical protein [Motilimonas cestriensis]